MKLLKFLVTCFVLISQQAVNANPTPPSSPRIHLPFPANNFVTETLKDFNLVKTSNYVVDFMHISGLFSLFTNKEMSVFKDYKCYIKNNPI